MKFLERILTYTFCGNLQNKSPFRLQWLNSEEVVCDRKHPLHPQRPLCHAKEIHKLCKVSQLKGHPMFFEARFQEKKPHSPLSLPSTHFIFDFVCLTFHLCFARVAFPVCRQSWHTQNLPEKHHCMRRGDSVYIEMSGLKRRDFSSFTYWSVITFPRVLFRNLM